MKLYFSPGACSLSPHIVLREAKVAADLEQVDLKTKKTKSGADYAAINPKGQVPALVLDDGKMLTEGPAIVQYLADQKAESGLAPRAGTFERYRLARVAELRLDRAAQKLRSAVQSRHARRLQTGRQGSDRQAIRVRRCASGKERSLPSRLTVHRCRRVPLRHDAVVELSEDRHRAVAEPQGLRRGRRQPGRASARPSRKRDWRSSAPQDRGASSGGRAPRSRPSLRSALCAAK